MLQFQYMAPWVPTFLSCMAAELETTGQPFVTFQLATVDSKGFPHVRTLVYRDFLFNNKTTNTLLFTTDRRMEKYKQLSENDNFEAVFYFSKSKKQFRFRGKAKVLNDEFKPLIDLSNIFSIPVSPIDDADSLSHVDRDEDDDDGVVFSSSNSVSTRTSVSSTSTIQHKPSDNAIKYPIFSPNFLVSNKDVSYSNLTELNAYPPTDEEWNDEIQRVWDSLSLSMKSSFRKPTPKSKRTAEEQKKIDRISRGVDGQSVEVGLKNFTVVCLFIESLDYVDLEKDRRYLYDRDDYESWKELEVCP